MAGEGSPTTWEVTGTPVVARVELGVGGGESGANTLGKGRVAGRMDGV